MKFKTKKTSWTGKRFALLQLEIDRAHLAASKLAKDLGAKSWRRAPFSVFGGISCLHFENEPDPKIWKKLHDGYSPKKNSKAGKDIHNRIMALPTIIVDRLNHCVGFEGGPFKSIGYNSNNADYFGFSVGDDWEFNAPDDCVEITVNEYKKLFGK
ncbi:hypothetical protein [Spongiimicrobium salis]|uniref:hypothetical protein n=1 Tax=Spongiimicrobium salis TaxID=1667022 RepID=UPI00374CE07E